MLRLSHIKLSALDLHKILLALVGQVNAETAEVPLGLIHPIGHPIHIGQSVGSLYGGEFVLLNSGPYQVQDHPRVRQFNIVILGRLQDLGDQGKILHCGGRQVACLRGSNVAHVEHAIPANCSRTVNTLFSAELLQHHLVHLLIDLVVIGRCVLWVRTLLAKGYAGSLTHKIHSLLLGRGNLCIQLGVGKQSNCSRRGVSEDLLPLILSDLPAHVISSPHLIRDIALLEMLQGCQLNGAIHNWKAESCLT